MRRWWLVGAGAVVLGGAAGAATLVASIPDNWWDGQMVTDPCTPGVRAAARTHGATTVETGADDLGPRCTLQLGDGFATIRIFIDPRPTFARADTHFREGVDVGDEATWQPGDTGQSSTLRAVSGRLGLEPYTTVPGEDARQMAVDVARAALADVPLPD